MFKNLIGLALLAAASCAPYHSETCKLYIDPGFSPEQIQAIIASTEAWEKATDGIARFDIVVAVPGPNVQHPHRIYPVLGTSHRIQEIDAENHTTSTLGWAERPYADEPVRMSDAGDVMIVVDRIEDAVSPMATFTHVVTHELGHHFGLPHAGAGTLMFPHTDRTTDDQTCITAADVAAICGLYGTCGKNVKQTCVER